MDDFTPGIESLAVTVRDHRIRYFKAGSGPAVVLVHGGASDAREWQDTMAALADGYTCYAPDLIGFGASERRDGGYYLDDFIEFLEEFIGVLGLEKASLVGHSFGARLVLGVVVSRPDIVEKIVLEDAAGLGKTSLLGLVLVSFFNGLRRLFRRPQPAPTFLSHDGEDPDWACVDDLPGVNVPALLIWKRFDPYLPVANARRAVELMPDARLVELPGYGHAPHQHRKDAHVFQRLLREFLESGKVTPG